MAHRLEIQYRDKHKSPMAFHAVQFELNQFQMRVQKHSDVNAHMPELLQGLQLSPDPLDESQTDYCFLKYCGTGYTLY